MTRSEVSETVDFNIFYIQSLGDAGGTIVNMDYFPVIITTMPINSETGQLYTPNGLIDFFRRNINEFVKLNGGNSNRLFPIKERPDWDKVDEILMGNRLRSNLGCN